MLNYVETGVKYSNLCHNLNSVFCFVRKITKEWNNLEGGRYLRGTDERLGFIEEDRAKIKMENIERIMNEENKWYQMLETDVVEEPVEKVTGPTQISVEKIVASDDVGVKVTTNLCQRVNC